MATATVISGTAADLLERLGVDPVLVSNGDLVVRTPITGEEIGLVARTSEAETAAAVARAVAAFEAWRDVPRRVAASSCGCWARSSGPRRTRSARS